MHYRPDLYVENVAIYYNTCCTVVTGTVYNKGSAETRGHVLIRGLDRSRNEVEKNDCYTDPVHVPPHEQADFTWYFQGYRATQVEVSAIGFDSAPASAVAR